MTPKIQTFPPVHIKALDNGLFQLSEDWSGERHIIELHPAQVQVLASMVGFTMPDKTRAALGRVASRLKALKAQMGDLEGRLRYAVHEQDIEVVPELTAAEFIAFNLRELLHDLEAIQAPGLEPTPESPANPGGQLTIDL